MPSFSVADLKASAGKAKSFGADKFSSARDRYTSPASKNLAWDTVNGPPPPPPPLARSSTSVSHAKSPPPPPSHPRASLNIERTQAASQSQPNSPSSPTVASPRVPPARPPPLARPRQDGAAAVARTTPGAPQANKIDWANLTSDDKQVLFSWLDEYFSTRLNLQAPLGRAPDAIQQQETHVAAPAPQRPSQTSTPVRAPGPPPIPKWSRPAEPSPAPSVSDQADSFTSYPPPTEYGSAALDLAQYFSPSTHWDSTWYTTANPMPPPLQGSPNVRFVAAWEMLNTSKTLFAGVLFSDLSMCWFSVKFSTVGRADANDARTVQRSAMYLPRPNAMDGAALQTAHETYGDTIAGFAESYDGSGEFCARGECWDLANEALKYFEQFDYVPAPVPSISRTHGHLIFEGKASGKGLAHQLGRWRGGDDRVRRGDIVEWRSARVSTGPGSFSTLGDPEHTAVIVADAVPSVTVADGESVRPADLGTLEVVEQSVKSPPKRVRYPLSGFEAGEIWIYRPISMLEYVGTLLEPKCPSGVSVLSI